MDHGVMGLILMALGVVELAAWRLRLRWWVFTPQERRFLREEGEEAVFRRRLISGITGLAVGVLVYVWGNF